VGVVDLSRCFGWVWDLGFGVGVAVGAARALQADMRGLITSGRAVRRAGAAV
jgi:hypothetical protein